MAYCDIQILITWISRTHMKQQGENDLLHESHGRDSKKTWMLDRR